MGIVAKTNTFTGVVDPQLPWIDTDLDTLYVEINGKLDNDNIKANADIAQSKISGLLASLASKLSNIGDTITGAFNLKSAFPYVRFIGTEGPARDWRLIENDGHMYFQSNSGTELSPTWVLQYLVEYGGTPSTAVSIAPKSYVDAAVAANTSGLNFVQVIKKDASQTTTSLVPVGVAFMGINFSTGARRIKVSFSGSVENNSDDGGVEVLALVDGAVLGGTGGTAKVIGPVGARAAPVAFTLVTPILTADVHTVGIYFRAINGGTAKLWADSATAAVMVVEELPYSPGADVVVV